MAGFMHLKRVVHSVGPLKNSKTFKKMDYKSGLSGLAQFHGKSRPLGNYSQFSEDFNR
jgi:hypothetical protein